MSKLTDPFQVRLTGTTFHGNLPIDVPFMTEIEPRLFLGGCASGLVLPTSIKHLVSLYPWEKYAVRHNLDTELYIRMQDSLDEGFDFVEVLAPLVVECWQKGPTLVHCQAGLNRSSLVVARALMLDSGYTADTAIHILREKRSPAVLCNEHFDKYLRSLP